jgi:hypothetical protein
MSGSRSSRNVISIHSSAPALNWWRILSFFQDKRKIFGKKKKKDSRNALYAMLHAVFSILNCALRNPQSAFRICSGPTVLWITPKRNCNIASLTPSPFSRIFLFLDSYELRRGWQHNLGFNRFGRPRLLDLIIFTRQCRVNRIRWPPNVKSAHALKVVYAEPAAKFCR